VRGRVQCGAMPRKSRPLRLPPDVPAVDPKRPATALAALDAIAVRCSSMSITFAGLPSTPPPLPREAGRLPKGVARMQASIEGGRRFPRDPLCVGVSFKGINAAWGFTTTLRKAFGIIRRVPKFRVDPKTLGTRIARGPVDTGTFRELARLGMVAVFGAKATAIGPTTERQRDPVDPLEQAFARSKEVYIASYKTTRGSWFDIRSQPLYGGGKKFEGSFWRTTRKLEADTFGDLIAKLAALPDKQKPTITDATSVTVKARGSGLSSSKLTKLVLAVLERALGPGHLLRPS